VAEDFIIEMSQDRPGISFWNQILSPFPCGGAWFEDNLWLEPITQWADTNITTDYFMMDGLLLFLQMALPIAIIFE